MAHNLRSITNNVHNNREKLHQQMMRDCILHVQTQIREHLVSPKMQRAAMKGYDMHTFTVGVPKVTEDQIEAWNSGDSQICVERATKSLDGHDGFSIWRGSVTHTYHILPPTEKEREKGLPLFEVCVGW